MTHKALWGYKGEEKLHLGIREQITLITTDLECVGASTSDIPMAFRGLL
jgi:hypothetical protein